MDAARFAPMPLILQRDPRPTGYDSVAEAVFAADDAGDIIDASVEMAVWGPVQATVAAEMPELAFVDGVERRECRVWGTGDGLPRLGMMVSYGAGAIVPGSVEPVRHVEVHHRILMTKGGSTPVIRLRADNTVVEYEPAHNAGEDIDSIGATLRQLRADLEARVVIRLIDEHAGLIVVDGRLPPITHSKAVGLIKTPHRIPVAEPAHIEVLMKLRAGERSPVFRRRRSERDFYSWFVGLRDLGRFDVALSNLALIEMDDAVPRAEALEVANVTASALPLYASAPYEDPRAPQNLLPVAQLERELRHRLGDADIIDRLSRTWFADEEREWFP